MDQRESTDPRARTVLAPVSSTGTNIVDLSENLPQKGALPHEKAPTKQQPAGIPGKVNYSFMRQAPVRITLPSDPQYAAMNSVNLTSSAGHLPSNYSYQASNYNPLPYQTSNHNHVSFQATTYNPVPRTQVYHIPQSTVSQPVQNYPGHQFASSIPGAVTQNSTTYTLPPSVGSIKFSLTSPKDFTILGSKYRYGNATTDDSFVESFRSDIERLSSSAGGATFEQPGNGDDEEELLGTARWRVPLKAYDDIFSFFEKRDDVHVEGIPRAHLDAAYLHLQHLEQGYPEPKALVEKGIPTHLTSTLTGYQRGGVNFVLSKNGRALIADEMGLGKTLQSIAAMCAYAKEGPLLVICPSSVRFNWKAEVLQWLGKGAVGMDTKEQHPAFVTESNIQVFITGKDEIKEEAKVIIVSYDLFTNMVKKGKIVESTFTRIIVDESHMLKNTKAQRTKAALPILKSAKRCILLSGTPAFKNPSELFPQLHVLGGGKWWTDEKDFKEKYCYKSSSVGGRNNLELFSLMSSTVMIRRKKADVLKQVLPEKNRDLVHVTVDDPSARKKLDVLMDSLRDSQGNLGAVARGLQKGSKKSGSSAISDDHAVAGLEADLKFLDLEENRQIDDIEALPIKDGKAFLPELFELTGRVKVKVIISQLKQWLNENEGKIIIFAHHHSVLDNIEGSLQEIPTIRIDGKTNPKKRQELVVSFQKDARVRVAVLSTTAAGVGITLTASATVWFAEMYWTPGLLIQAEDRSHRIGQKKDVNVLYYVARDTLDEVLWKLAVRKFIAVGEMVDGSTNTLGVNKKGDAALLDVSLVHGDCSSDGADDKVEKTNAVVGNNDAGWGCVADDPPSVDGGFSTTDHLSSVDGSFDSDCLSDSDESEDSDSDDSVIFIPTPRMT